MCLHINKKKRLKFKNGRLVCYKVVQVSRNKLRSLIFDDYIWKPGWNVAKGTTDVAYGCIYGGVIHVFTNKKEAMSRYFRYKLKIMKVTCLKKDLVSVGIDSDACFKKVFLSKPEYNQAIKVSNKYEKL